MRGSFAITIAIAIAEGIAESLYRGCWLIQASPSSEPHGCNGWLVCGAVLILLRGPFVEVIV